MTMTHKTITDAFGSTYSVSEPEIVKMSEYYKGRFGLDDEQIEFLVRHAAAHADMRKVLGISPEYYAQVISDLIDAIEGE